MDKHIADRWVQALRSGQYKQGQAALHPAPESYCCLGVLCDLYRVEQGKGEWRQPPNRPDTPDFVVPNGGITEFGATVLPAIVMNWAGMESVEGHCPGSESLASLNDEGMGFPELANLIEKKWEVL